MEQPQNTPPRGRASSRPPSRPAWPSLPAMMFDRARLWPARTVFRCHRDGAWHDLAWADFARQAASAARGLRAAGVTAGDRVLLVSENRPEVAAAEVALMAIRAIPVPAYPANTPADHAHLLRDSGARTAIVSTPALAVRVREAAALASGLDRLVALDPGVPDSLAWADLASDPAPPDDIAAEAAGIRPGTMACLLYTSGTGGPPRGVMLPHRAILANCAALAAVVEPIGIGHGTYLSFLPASHSYEHTVGLFLFPSLGFEVVHGRGIEHLAADLLAVRPQVISLVPRLLEAVRGRILTQRAALPAWRRALFDAALAAGLRRLDGRSTPTDRLLAPALDRLVRARVRARFGGRLVAAVSGAARLDPATERFFAALGLHVMQGYGQTEAGPVISVNPFARPRPGTVGRPLDGVDLRLADDGELLVRGPLLMDGYWRQPEATARTIRDGWLHTGDIAALDPDGHLRITDRKRDVIILSGGEKVFPAAVEARLAAEPEIAQAVVSGDGRAALSALLVPAPDASPPAVAAALARANATLSVTERVRRHALVEPFTVENGLLTPSQKIRRALVLERHAALLPT
ncbi:MAG: AMP-dependent synthetase/ligase [Janthinobacterium lividum]